MPSPGITTPKECYKYALNLVKRSEPAYIHAQNRQTNPGKIVSEAQISQIRLQLLLEAQVYATLALYSPTPE